MCTDLRTVVFKSRNLWEKNLFLAKNFLEKKTQTILTKQGSLCGYLVQRKLLLWRFLRFLFNFEYSSSIGLQRIFLQSPNKNCKLAYVPYDLRSYFALSVECLMIACWFDPSSLASNLSDLNMFKMFRTIESNFFELYIKAYKSCFMEVTALSFGSYFSIIYL